MSTRILVCTFATKEYAGSAAVLRHTALHVGGADEVIVYREADVQPWFRDFPELLQGRTRGYGWWSWKPWCIWNTLTKHAKPGDVVVYCDAAMTIEAPLRPYAEAADHVLLFRLAGWTRDDRTNACWTKRDTFALMGRNTEAHRAAVQVNAAIQVYRHTPQALEFVDTYKAWCSKREVIDDAHALENYGEFRDHRHDQSVVSLLALDDGAPVRLARDPTQYAQEDATDPARQVPAITAEPLVHHHRRRMNPVKVAVITPTIGTKHLAACIRSVQLQTLPNVEHYIVVDGPQYREAVDAVVRLFRNQGVIHVVQLPQNVGAGGWNGHRVYGSLPWLCPDASFVAYLDEDNEFDPDHLRSLVRAAVDATVPWAYSLRRIVDEEGQDVCPDNCESLGGISHTVCGPGDYLIDTSCYLIERTLAIEISPTWNAPFRGASGVEPDRQVCQRLLATAPYACVRKHSVRYRTGNTGLSVRAAFFKQGNRRWGYDFGAFQDLYIFHFSPKATADFLACRRDDSVSHALDEWQMTLLRGLDGRPGRADGYNLLDGYAQAGNIPAGAAVLVSMCQPQDVPWDFLASRKDVWRVAYTLESPNIRHAAQWDPELLAKHFDVVLTYFKPLLDLPALKTLFCPHNTHHLDFDNPLDLAQMRTNVACDRSCAMVLERRGLSGEYTIPNLRGVELRCLEPLREALVCGLSDVTVYGVGWDVVAAANPGVKLGHALHRSQDPRHAVDILQTHSFAVIVENCDAEWYASEKLYDALLAGCVPLYYGSVPPHLAIPEGPETGVYLDLKARGISTGNELQRVLDGLSDAEVAAWKARVAAVRADILKKVGTAAFAATVKQALALRPAKA